MNCCVLPNGIVGASGLIAIDTTAAGVTANVAVALTDPELIPIVVVPVPSVVANPAVFVVLLIVATAALLDVQCPDCVTSCVVPSVYVPVAVNCGVNPTGTLVLAGLIVIDTNAAAVTVNPVDPLTPPTVALMFAVP